MNSELPRNKINAAQQEISQMKYTERKPFMSITEASALLDEGKLTPVDLVEMAIEATNAQENSINAYITFTPEQARKEAVRMTEDIRRHGRKSMLHGIPYAVKDLIDAKGLPTTMASKGMQNNIPAEDDPNVANLRNAGAILMGKTNTQEWGIGPAGDQSYYGPVHNPWDTDLISGGSSSGSCAAVATGMVPIALGSDGGGSIRIPASLCSVVGLKTTYRLLGAAGAGASKILFSDHLSVKGPIAATSEDAAIMMDALDPKHGGYLDTVRSFGSLAGKRFVIPNNLFKNAVEPGIGDVFEENVRALAKHGAVIIEEDIPWMESIPAMSSSITFPEAAFKHRERLKNSPECYQPFIKARLETGFGYTALQYIEAMEKREEAILKLEDFMSDKDAIIMPTLPITAYPLFQTEMDFLGEKKNCSELLVKHTRTANVIGCPALSVPGGFTCGLPVGLMMTGAMGADAKLLALGHLFEKARDN